MYSNETFFQAGIEVGIPTEGWLRDLAMNSDRRKLLIALVDRHPDGRYTNE